MKRICFLVLFLIIMMGIMAGCGSETPEAELSPVEVAVEGEAAAFDLSMEDFISRWNAICGEEVLPAEDDEGWEVCTSESAIHSDGAAVHYVYTEGEDSAFYPMIHVYLSEDSGRILEIEINYDQHNMREGTYEIYKEMCFDAMKAILPSMDDEELSDLATEINNMGNEHAIPAGTGYERGSLPNDMYCLGNAAAYPYFPVGSRMHFCVIPVNEEVLAGFEAGGVNLISAGE